MLLIPLRDGQIDLQQQRVSRGDKQERLTDREVELLRYLAARAGQVVPRSEIFTEVWDYAPNVVSRAVDATMRRLRKKIEMDPSSPIHLFSTYGQGYRFEYLDGTVPSEDSAELPEEDGPPGSLLHMLHLGAAETRLFGRRQEVATVLALFEQGASVVTVMATGGMGKTRLAEEVGRLLVYHETYSGGVWFCDLVEARDASEVIQAVSSTLSCPIDAAFHAPEAARQVGLGLSSLGPAFVILDNFEQIADFALETVGVWSQLAPEIRFMVTSRQRLDLDEEQVFELRPLNQSEGSELFMDRARAINPSFDSSADNMKVVHEIVDALEGIPLAIQLAAGRSRLLSARQIRDRLSRRFRLLRKGGGVPDGRQTTMRAAIDWSWNLLNDAERMVLQQVSVFRGGFTLESAEAVVDLSALGPKAPWLDEVLQSLADKSMLFVRSTEQQQSENRICTFDSIRYYALEKLEQEGDVALAEARHAEYHLGWLKDQNALHLSGNLALALQLARQEVDNFQIAFERLVESKPDLALELSEALSSLFHFEGWFDIGLAMSERLDAKMHQLNKAQQTRAFALRSRYLMELKRLPEAREEMQGALERLPGDWALDRRHQVWLQNARLKLYEKDFDGLKLWLARIEESTDLAVGLQARILSLRAESALHLGNMVHAADLFDAAWRKGADGVQGQFRMRVRSFQGLMCCLKGDLLGGRTIIQEMMSQRKRLGKQTHIAVDLDNLGQIDLLLGDSQAAAVKLQEAVGIWHRTGHVKRRRSQLVFVAVAHQLSGEAEAAKRAIDWALQGLPEDEPLWPGIQSIHAALLGAWGRVEEGRALWEGLSEAYARESGLSEADIELLGRCHFELPKKEAVALVQRPELRLLRTETEGKIRGLAASSAHVPHFILLEKRLGLSPYSL